MKHTEPLRMNYEFARVYKRGRFLAGSLVVVHYFRRKGPGGNNRLGVTVSKQVSGSVRRNRIKRLLRESYRLQESLLETGYDIILTGRKSDPPPAFAQIDRELGRLLRRAGIRRPPAAPDPATAGQKALAGPGAASRPDNPEAPVEIPGEGLCPPVS